MPTKKGMEILKANPMLQVLGRHDRSEVGQKVRAATGLKPKGFTDEERPPLPAGKALSTGTGTGTYSVGGNVTEGRSSRAKGRGR